ncbi:hypothetical protein KKC1_33060 [Calderihabitans maritimus]|uniref:Uncharacterized protein n=1 Tax=Calderihabitans maritimus TaxID=1246530 RepID=A0A1Z5HXD2_9FIRM|nr:hypothetical protein KKC1_33060 [Calderihabitans maritimus]
MVRPSILGVVVMIIKFKPPIKGIYQHFTTGKPWEQSYND